MVLTDGSGRTGTPRIDSTKNYLATLGLECGPLFGRFTDQVIYAKILQQDFDFFHALSEEICQTLISQNIDQVVADSAEGYNSVHDVCRLIVDTAVEMSGRQIVNCEYPVIGSLKGGDAVNKNYRVSILREGALARKIASASAHFPELLEQIKQDFPALADRSHAKTDSPLGREYLRERSYESEYSFAGMPYYEKWGNEQVANGNYKQTIRYLDHMLPIAKSLHQLGPAEVEVSR